MHVFGLIVSVLILDAYLTKPINVQNLLGTLKSNLGMG
jgi:hypothetical protein